MWSKKLAQKMRDEREGRLDAKETSNAAPFHRYTLIMLDPDQPTRSTRNNPDVKKTCGRGTGGCFPGAVLFEFSRTWYLMDVSFLGREQWTLASLACDRVCWVCGIW